MEPKEKITHMKPTEQSLQMSAEIHEVLHRHGIQSKTIFCVIAFSSVDGNISTVNFRDGVDGPLAINLFCATADTIARMGNSMSGQKGS